jgi:hypothetical protein
VSDFVEIETVGEYLYKSNLAHVAVKGRLKKDELIMILFEQNESLQDRLIESEKNRTIVLHKDFLFTPRQESEVS